MSNFDARKQQLERLDRQVHAMGMSAAKRLLDTTFLVIGLDTTGSEIARNILLGGCSRLILCDDGAVTTDDIETNFFITKDDVVSDTGSEEGGHVLSSSNKSKGLIMAERLAPLSPDSHVESITEEDLASIIVGELTPPTDSRRRFADVVILANLVHDRYSEALISAIDDWKLKKSTQHEREPIPRFIHVRCAHLVAAFYNDFGGANEFLFTENALADDTSVVPLRVTTVTSTSLDTVDESLATYDICIVMDGTASSRSTLEAIETCRALRIRSARANQTSDESIQTICSVISVTAAAKINPPPEAVAAAAPGVQDNSSKQDNMTSKHFAVTLRVKPIGSHQHHLLSHTGDAPNEVHVSLKEMSLHMISGHSGTAQWSPMMAFVTPTSLPQVLDKDVQYRCSLVHTLGRWGDMQPQCTMIGAEADSFWEETSIAVRLLDTLFADSRQTECGNVGTAVSLSREVVLDRCRCLLEEARGDTSGTASVRKLISSFALHGQRTFLPVASMVAGIVAQEAMKAATQQHRPTSGVWSFDARWLLSHTAEAAGSVAPTLAEGSGPHATMQERLFGVEGAAKLANAKLFLVGAGAIGCEYLKHFSVMGIACGKRGRLDVTDPDHIELSNLSRQFLFQLRDVKQSKSAVAVAKARKRANALKARAFGKALTPATCLSWKPFLGPPRSTTFLAPPPTPGGNGLGTFHSDFLAPLDALVGAVDNNEARNFLDEIAARFSIPMVDSGTLGLQGHVVSVVPNVTARLTDGASPSSSDGGSIPFCTLHYFPSNVQHCIQWGLNAFHELLSEPWVGVPDDINELTPASLRESWSVKLPGNMLEQARLASGMLEAVTFRKHCHYGAGGAAQSLMEGDHQPLHSNDGIARESPNADRCTRLAFAIVKLLQRRFVMMFVDPVEDLLQKHPPTYDAQGKLLDSFWLEKPQGCPPRCPPLVPAETNSAAHDEDAITAFVLAAAPLVCARVSEGDVAEVADALTPNNVYQFLAHECQRQETRAPDRSNDAAQREDKLDHVLDRYAHDICAAATAVASGELPTAATPIVFDKDEPSGQHVRLVAVCSNIRAWTYFIPRATEMEVKRISGRIVPAFISTTSTITSFAVMQLMSILLLAQTPDSVAAEQQSKTAAGRNCSIVGDRTISTDVAAVLRESLRDINVSLSDVSLSFVMEPSRPRRTNFALGVESPITTTWSRWRIDSSSDITIKQFLQTCEDKFRLTVVQIVDVVTAQLLYDAATDGGSARTEFLLLAFLHEIWKTKSSAAVSAAAGASVVVVAPPLRNAAELRIFGYRTTSAAEAEEQVEDIPTVVYSVAC